VEFVKERQAAFSDALPLSMGQLLSIPMMVVGIWLLVRRGRSRAAVPASPRPAG
jgi:prolipoprotein diacylglyceryltransferase